MKFLCPQCKAKYRIADEKLAERGSSKMKCRKCGHVIDVRSAAQPESVMPPPPEASSEDAQQYPGPRADAPRAVADAQPHRGAVAAPPPKRPAPVRGRAGATAQAVDHTPDHRSALAVAHVGRQHSSREDTEASPESRGGGALSGALFATAAPSGHAPSETAAEEWYVGINGAPVGPLTLVALREKAASGEATGESLVWKDGFEDWKPLASFPELATVVEVAEENAPSTAQVAAAVAVALAAVPPTVVADPPAAMLEELSGRRQRHGTHPAAWVAVVVALCFGVTLGVVLFSKTERHEVVKIVEVEKAVERPAPEPSGGAEVLEEATVEANGTPRRSNGSGAAKGPAPAAQPSAGSPMLRGLGGLDLGPAAGQKGPASPGGSAAGGQLDGASIQRTVANFTPSVRRGCWQPALEGRAADAPSSARVAMTITVAGSGNVENVTTSGDPKGYPGLARCIQSRVSGWKFPRSSGTTTVNVPFVFAAQ